MTRFFDALGRFSVKFRYPIVLVWLAGAVAASQLLPVVVVVIGVLLALVLRSVVAPLYLIVSVLLSYLAALGLAVVVFIGIRGDEGLPFFLPFLMFLFLLALGEDYNILAMTRIREESHHLPLREAVTQAVNATGSTITSAGLVLLGRFNWWPSRLSRPEHAPSLPPEPQPERAGTPS